MLDLDTLIKHCELVDKRFLSTVRRLIARESCDKWLANPDLHLMSLSELPFTPKRRALMFKDSLCPLSSLAYMERRLFLRIYHKIIKNSGMNSIQAEVTNYFLDLIKKDVLLLSRSDVLTLRMYAFAPNLERSVSFGEFDAFTMQITLPHLKNAIVLSKFFNKEDGVLTKTGERIAEGLFKRFDTEKNGVVPYKSIGALLYVLGWREYEHGLVFKVDRKGLTLAAYKQLLTDRCIEHPFHIVRNLPDYAPVPPHRLHLP